MRTIAEAEAIVGRLGKPSKMPGYAYGLPATKCPVGSLLVKRPGTVCSNCYALKGRYLFPAVVAAQERRLRSLKDPRWVETMVWLLKRRKCKWFRWHDSGDLQGPWHLEKIFDVAEQCPEIQFWLPTRERLTVLSVIRPIPPNLVIRMSATLIDGAPPIGFKNTSTVVTESARATCPAPHQGGKCGQCRACWTPEVQNVSYKKH